MSPNKMTFGISVAPSTSNSLTFGVSPTWENTIATINEAMNKPDWFYAIVFSAVQLERFGYIILKEAVESEMKKTLDLSKLTKKQIKSIWEMLGKIHLPQVGVLLLAFGKIAYDEYTAILKINGFRNQFIHQRELKKYVTGEKAKKIYKPWIDRAIMILGKLGAH
jgi:hypothetical protein